MTARDGKEIVSLWLVGLWASPPSWLNRMPDRKEVDELIAAIDAELARSKVSD